MAGGFKTFLIHIFTEIDGESFDINRVAFAIAVLSFVGMAWWSVIVNKQEIAWLEAGAGFAAVLAGGGGALAVNRKNQNGANPDAGASPPPEGM